MTTVPGSTLEMDVYMEKRNSLHFMILVSRVSIKESNFMDDM